MEEAAARVTVFITANAAWAGPIVGLLAFGELLAIVGVLIPATAILLTIGGLAGAGLIDPLQVILWAIGGAILGDWISYWMGRSIGPSIYHRWPLNRHRPMVARARLFFRRHGFIAVFLGRFLGPIRATIPLVAGVMKMSKRRFQLANIASACIWGPLMMLPGLLTARSLGPTGIGEGHILAFGAGIVVMTVAATAITSRVLGGGRRRKR